jgi:cellulose synthase/poly-beta-1,6-N-acetylglucosamine synthase-like glycosyltransferase|tara:strand:- start:78 stop:1253 length:1176 start_codon:yes stop_codon:yes gene_type:complete
VTTLWIIAFIGAVWWLWQSMCIAKTLRAVRPLPPGRIVPPTESPPLVSVICPARDEADAIEAAIRTRLTDTVPWMEFIFVDDRSSDGTGEILERECEQDARARLVRNAELPAGWLGKVHAQQVGVDHARVREDGWYLFSDGDTHVHPGAVEAAIAWAEQEQADHVALTPRITRGTWLLRLCITPLMRVLICTLRMWLANDDSQPRAMGVGAFNLVRRAALERAGGLSELRLEVADDVGVGRIVKGAGGRSRTAIGVAWLDIEWYRTAGQFLRGSEKGVAKARTRLGILRSGLLGVAVICVDISPFVLLAWLPTPAALLATATAAMAVLMSVQVARAFGLSVWWSLLAPLGAFVALLISFRALGLGLLRGGVRWRGDTHTLAATTDGERVRL